MFPTLNHFSFEKKNHSKPENAIGFGREVSERLYRQDEINDIVAKMVAYKRYERNK